LDFLLFKDLDNFIPIGIIKTLKHSATGVKGTAKIAEKNLENTEKNINKNKAKYKLDIWKNKNMKLSKSLNNKKSKNIFPQDIIFLLCHSKMKSFSDVLWTFPISIEHHGPIEFGHHVGLHHSCGPSGFTLVDR
jgi:hypothetical protein